MKYLRTLQLLFLLFIQCSIVHLYAQSLSIEYNNSGDRNRLAAEERGVTAVSEGGSLLQAVSIDSSQGVSSAVISYNESSKSLTDNRLNSSYSVGSIPVTPAVTPSGGMTYTIPIPTAAGYNNTPELSLVFNSQGGEGNAGYGWNLSGFSCITVRNRSFYYDSINSPARYDATDAVYALDGAPLVQDALATSFSYDWSTPTGHILVKKHCNPSGQVLYFTAKMPDGGSAVYGFTSATAPEAIYPITQMTDADGNVINYTYTRSSGNGQYYLSGVTYGTSQNASISFQYDSRDDYAPGSHFAAKPFYNDRILKSVTSYDGNTVISSDVLYHSNNHGTYLLDSLMRSRGSSHLNPLRFEYGASSEDTTFSLSLCSEDMLAGLSPSPLVLSRGKMASGDWHDGVIAMGQYSPYGVIDYDPATGNCQWGSTCPTNADIIIFPILGLDEGHGLKALTDFHSIQSLDIDGDGQDEIVKVSLGVDAGGQKTGRAAGDTTTVLSFEIRKYAQDSLKAYRTASISFNSYHREGSFLSPENIYLTYGDFRGRGRIEALAIEAPIDGSSSGITAAVLDLYDGTVSITSSLPFNPYGENTTVFCQDIDGDCRTEVCRATETGFKIYRFDNGGFVQDAVVTNIGLNHAILSRMLTYGDVNGDGYLDILTTESDSTSIMVHHYDGIRFTEGYALRSEVLAGDQYQLLDVNQDGLADLVRIRDSKLTVFFNVADSSSDPFDAQETATRTFPSGTVIVPSSIVTPYGMSGLLTIEGDDVKSYSYATDRSALRLMTSMTDSYGMQQQNTFKDISNLTAGDDTYSINPNRSYTATEGYCRQTPPIKVLAQTATYIPGCLAPLDSLRYRYRDAVFHQRGLGFRGFGETTVINSTRNTTDARLFTTTVYDPENSGVVLNVYKRLASENAEPFETTTNNWQKIFRPYAKHIPRLRASYTESPLTGFATSESYTYDNLDFVKTVSSDKTELGEWRRRHSQQSSSSEQANSAVNSEENPSYLQVITTNTYSHLTDSNTGKYILGRITKCIEERGNDIESGEISWRGETVTTFQTNGVHPVNVKHYVGWNDESRARLLEKETKYTYDTYGNVLSALSAPYGATLDAAFTGEIYGYDNNGRYMLSKTDALGRVTQYSSYNVFGKPTAVTDCRGNTTQYTYDSWGNLTTVTYPEGRTDNTVLAWAATGAPAGAVYSVTTTSNAAPTQISWLDALGREIRSSVTRFDGSIQKTDRSYTTTGETAWESMPYKGDWSSATMRTQWQYDAYGRPVSSTEPSGRTSTWSYNGRTTSSTIDGVWSTKVIGADGNIESATDAGGTIAYAYNANGTLSSVTAPGNVVTTFSYDPYGRRASMNDPSAGTRSDTYAVYGTRHTSINAKGSVQTWMDYTGRVASVYRTSTETGASDAGTFSTSYTYNAYGDLTDVVSISSDSGNNSATHYTYDIYGRPSTVQDVAPDGKSLTRTYSYNSTGQLTSTTYTASSGWTVTESHTYANGYLTQTSAGGNIIWRLDAENALGQPTQATTGSITRTYSFNSYGLPTGRTMGSVMDFRYSYNGATGNMVSRTDYSRSLTETFAYDSLSRLVSSSGNTADTRTFTYANNGNKTQMTGLGTMSYSDSNHPYRVTGGDVTGMGSLSYSAAYTAFDRPAVLSCTDQESGAITDMAFTYDAAHERVRTVLTFDSQSKRDIEVTAVKHYYLGGRYELVETDVYDPQAKGESSITTRKERLYLGGDAYSAPVVVIRNNGSGNGTYYNIGRDVQGSITHIATMSGTLVAEYSYDPWGRLRNPATHALYDVLSAPDLMLGRGYTGHEYIPEAGLWNANARLYDPFLGCFLSPDPYIQAPDFTQNLNRYAYCLNNPLKYSDESGEFFVIDSFVIGLIGGGWKRAKQMALNDLKIWGGLFISDKNKKAGGRVWEVVSRFTWQIPQTVIGFLIHQTVNTFRIGGGIEKVEYLHGATVSKHHNNDWGGLTMGNYILGNNRIEAQDDNYLFQHEFGHYLQSQEHGLLWLFDFAIESGISAIINDYYQHNAFYTEQNANARSLQYFAKYYGEGYAEIVWNFSLNPITDYNASKSYSENLAIIKKAIHPFLYFLWNRLFK